jgi:DNA-binding CsgD family transcriptional regulator
MSPQEELNVREVEVASLVWEGKTNPEIAALLGSSEQIVKNRLRGVFDKLGVWSRLELALYVAAHGGGPVGAGAAPAAEQRYEWRAGSDQRVNYAREGASESRCCCNKACNSGEMFRNRTPLPKPGETLATSP